MSNSDNPPVKTRPVCDTENTLCRAASGGTGVTVLSLLFNKKPDISALQNAIQTIQTAHPILQAKLHYDPANATFSFIFPSSSSSFHVASFDAETTAKIIQDGGPNVNADPDPFQIIVEHEINNNPWLEQSHATSEKSVDLLHGSVYEMHGGKWVVCVKVHTGACDRLAAVQVMKELTGLMKDGGAQVKAEVGEMSVGVEDCIPSGKTNKPFWTRGMDMLGYSLNSFKLSTLDYVDPNATRMSLVVRLLLDSQHTTKLLEECKQKGIKLCGALSAAAMMATRSSKNLADGEWEKYAVVTLTDCRELLEPPLSKHHVGFYHSAVLNTHDMNGAESFWDLATRTYTSFSDAKNASKHFTDMADLNFLMCRAIENPGLTPSSSLRTSFISVFEDAMADDEEANEINKELGIEDYLGCASTHGVGPSIAIFDTIRYGKLDCAFVYPYPLHSREQMQGVVDSMKKILIDSL